MEAYFKSEDTRSARERDRCMKVENVCQKSHDILLDMGVTCYTEDANKVEIVCSVTLEVERKHIYWVFERDGLICGDHVPTLLKLRKR